MYSFRSSWEAPIISFNQARLHPWHERRLSGTEGEGGGLFAFTAYSQFRRCIQWFGLKAKAELLTCCGNICPHPKCDYLFGNVFGAFITFQCNFHNTDIAGCLNCMPLFPAGCWEKLCVQLVWSSSVTPTKAQQLNQSLSTCSPL